MGNQNAPSNYQQNQNRQIPEPTGQIALTEASVSKEPLPAELKDQIENKMSQTPGQLIKDDISPSITKSTDQNIISYEQPTGNDAPPGAYRSNLFTESECQATKPIQSSNIDDVNTIPKVCHTDNRLEYSHTALEEESSQIMAPISKEDYTSTQASELGTESVPETGYKSSSFSLGIPTSQVDDQLGTSSSFTYPTDDTNYSFPNKADSEPSSSDQATNQQSVSISGNESIKSKSRQEDAQSAKANQNDIVRTSVETEQSDSIEMPLLDNLVSTNFNKFEPFPSSDDSQNKPADQTDDRTNESATLVKETTPNSSLDQQSETLRVSESFQNGQARSESSTEPSTTSLVKQTPVSTYSSEMSSGLTDVQLENATVGDAWESTSVPSYSYTETSNPSTSDKTVSSDQDSSRRAISGSNQDSSQGQGEKFRGYVEGSYFEATEVPYSYSEASNGHLKHVTIQAPAPQPAAEPIPQPTPPQEFNPEVSVTIFKLATADDVLPDAPIENPVDDRPTDEKTAVFNPNMMVTFTKTKEATASAASDQDAVYAKNKNSVQNQGDGDLPETPDPVITEEVDPKICLGELESKKEAFVDTLKDELKRDDITRPFKQGSSTDKNAKAIKVKIDHGKQEKH